MSNRPTKLVVDCTNNIETIVELTDEEISEMEASAAASAELDAIRQSEEAAKSEAKASAEAKLAALGLTPEEIAALR